MTTDSTPTEVPIGDRSAGYRSDDVKTGESTPTAGIVRDIARGGLAGLVVGFVLGGLGGRLVMRLAALLVPGAAGSLTENGNEIGAITLGGSLALIFFIGLFAGTIAASLWVIISPWLPAGGVAAALLTVPIAIALGTPALVDDANADFAILRHDPAVVASLVALIGAFGPALVGVDRWLNRRLPSAKTDGRAYPTYFAITVIGTFLTLVLVVPLFLGSVLALAGIGLVVVGLTTAATWWFQSRRQSPPRALTPIARVAVVLSTVAGLTATAREVAGALG